MKTLFVSLLLLVSGVSVSAQSAAPVEKPVATGEKKAPHPSFAEIEDVEGLPRVLILGDSISMGYTQPVRAALKGEANVHRPKANCGPTDNGLKFLDEWLGDGEWDVIHFNWGLHDVMHYLNGVAKEDRVSHTTEGAFRRNSPGQYEEKLRELVARLQETGATLIWASTTPIPESSKGLWKPGDAALYNKVAARVMEDNGIAVDDLWSFAKPELAAIQKDRDVHFSSEGSAVLGDEVARVIREALKVHRSK
ncbi:SGNH/GDSL hydrolase family protein [Verrucomicrobiales bacterium BCK34]|nr:SGNH/GDSL hydrolase family protein [Verrucomicrobiales bacterium BCK34]